MTGIFLPSPFSLLPSPFSILYFIFYIFICPCLLLAAIFKLRAFNLLLRLDSSNLIVMAGLAWLDRSVVIGIA
ncbi:MAG: hypothetical protein EBU30_02155 [Synechococcaceae bacterium WB6_3B_236]|nr:hypothetical protein [Synechococcaceae bacterium WB6_3B_236]